MPVSRAKVKVSFLMDAVGMNQPAAPLVSDPLPIRVWVAASHTGSSVCVPAGQPLGLGETLQ